MKIVRIESWREDLQLARPYTIAYETISQCSLLFVRFETDSGIEGLGSASPARLVTGETLEDAQAALQADNLDWLRGRSLAYLGGLLGEAQRRLVSTPAACAAVDMALYDLIGKWLDIPVVDFLGRYHDALPTSITIGIKSLDETLDEAREYVTRGFTCLKVKTGRDVEEDIARIRRLREDFGPAVTLRVDANQGYTPAQAGTFWSAVSAAVDLFEQPLPADAIGAARQLAATVGGRLVADESLHSPADALRLLAPPAACGVFNIKLMKCGGIAAARRIADLADAGGVELMWGCMDESVVSIAAALHAAFASPATSYLDLDGSFDLARDVAEGGFVLQHGVLRLTPRPGLGVVRASSAP